MHLVLATQRPADAITENIRANTNLRVALRVANDGESADVIGANDAARDRAEPAGPGLGACRPSRARAVPDGVRRRTGATGRRGRPRARRRLRRLRVVPRPCGRSPRGPRGVRDRSRDDRARTVREASELERHRRAAPAVAGPLADVVPWTAPDRTLADGGVVVGLSDRPEEQRQRPVDDRPRARRQRARVRRERCREVVRPA